MSVERELKKILAYAGVAAGLSMFAVGANAAPNPNFHIYIAYGQSNMAGNGDIVPSEDQANPPKNFIMLASHNANASQRSGKTNQSIKTGEWYPAIPPMFHPFENLSPADYFGRAMADSLPGVTVGIIPVAIGAVSIRAFDKDQYEAYFRGDGKDIMNWGWPKDYDNNPPGRILELTTTTLRDAFWNLPRRQRKWASSRASSSTRAKVTVPMPTGARPFTRPTRT